MRTPMLILLTIGLVSLTSCNQKADPNTMLDNKEARGEIMNKIINNQDFMTEFMQNMQNNNNTMQMMQGDKGMMNMMMKGEV